MRQCGYVFVNNQGSLQNNYVHKQLETICHVEKKHFTNRMVSHCEVCYSTKLTQVTYV